MDRNDGGKCDPKKPEENHELREMMGGLEERAGILQQAVEVLAERLACVLQEEPPSSECNKANQSRETEVGRNLQTTLDLINVTIMAVQSINRRCCV